MISFPNEKQTNQMLSFSFTTKSKKYTFKLQQKTLSLSEMKCKNNRSNVSCNRSNGKRKWVEERIARKCSFKAVYPFQKLNNKLSHQKTTLDLMVKSSKQEVVGTKANSLDRVRVSMAKLRQSQSKVSLPVNRRQSDSVAWEKTKTVRQN